MQQWFAVKSKPKRELQASTVLRQRGVEIYLPQLPTRRPGQRGASLESLFPGYLFARLALGTSDWIAARSAPGVAYFLGTHGVPSALPDDLIEHIRARVDGYRAQGGAYQPFQPKESVVIQAGPFAGLEAVFDRALSANGRVRVFLEVLSRLIPVELDVGLLRRAG